MTLHFNGMIFGKKTTSRRDMSFFSSIFAESCRLSRSQRSPLLEALPAKTGRPLSPEGTVFPFRIASRSSLFPTSSARRCRPTTAAFRSLLAAFTSLRFVFETFVREKTSVSPD